MTTKSTIYKRWALYNMRTLSFTREFVTRDAARTVKTKNHKIYDKANLTFVR